ncbi:hypothetical protein EQV77_10000 [Halobacillus fulvus]|nr:hypothetical protein EQV77_10000 [Halobacillus fulvus]
MYSIYYIIIAAVSIIALVGTLAIAKEMTKKEKEPSGKDDVEHLKQDGKGSSIPMLTVIYSITFVITVILCAIFIF